MKTKWVLELRRYGYPLLVAALVAVLVGGIFMVIQPIVMTDDSVLYVQNARWIAGYSNGRFHYWRTPLYPLMLAITQVAQLKTLIPQVLIQELMALAIPLLMYFSFARWNRWVACGISVAASLTLIPFGNANLIMTQELFYILLILTVLCAAYYLQSRNYRALYTLSLLCFATVMTRPQGSYLFLVFFGGTVLFERRHFRHWAAAFGIFLVLQFTYMACRPYFVKNLAATDTVLIPDSDRNGFIPSDPRLFARGLAFLKANMFGDARFFQVLMESPALRDEFGMAIVNRHVVRGEYVPAIESATTISDSRVRNIALLEIHAQAVRSGNKVAAGSALKHIDETSLRSHPERAGSFIGSGFDYTQLALPGERLDPRPLVRGLDLTNTSGKMLLFQIFNTADAWAQLRPENGPATALLYRLIDAYGLAQPEVMDGYPGAKQFRGSPHIALDYVFATPYDRLWSGYRHWFMLAALDVVLGPELGDKLCKAVYWEFARLHYEKLVSVYAQNFAFMFRVPFSPLLRPDIYSPEFNMNSVFFANVDFPTNPVFDKEIAQSKRFFELYSSPVVETMYLRGVQWIVFPLSLAALVIGVFIRSGPVFRLWLICWGAAAHQMLLISITDISGFNYYSIAYLLILMALGSGLCGLPALRKAWPALAS